MCQENHFWMTLRLISKKFLSIMNDVMQDVLKDLSNCTRSKGLGVNSEKLELVLFTRKYRMKAFKLHVSLDISVSI